MKKSAVSLIFKGIVGLSIGLDGYVTLFRSSKTSAESVTAHGNSVTKDTTSTTVSTEATIVAKNDTESDTSTDSENSTGASETATSALTCQTYADGTLI